ncbi:hypothetical protein PQB86_gp091 [Klebsiella phage Miami]|uniref:Uncharacterized protein n=1 Tax=Klebsiella phage Miami TaxID=2767581 RepID=A0A873WI87_9CAUD|nr:hypothetical protein PQB86_gp091 [Klebsiella phage Miami]QPB09186.1 hypothetical protein CPT_Miami_091 [Klebsiella phage Miami]
MSTFLLVVSGWFALSVICVAGYSFVREGWKKEDLSWSEFIKQSTICANVIKDKAAHKPHDVTLADFLSSEEVKPWLKGFDYDVEEKTDSYVITLRTPSHARDFLLPRQLFPNAA